jgi:hypothetical protein
MYPCTRARSSTVYMSPTIVMLIGWTAPAPIPCTARNTMRLSMLQAAPHSTEPRRNAPIPKNMIGLRPKTSASFPYSGTVTAWVSR